MIPASELFGADVLDAVGRPAVVTMATIQPDGRPHLSLVRPWLHDGVADVSLTDSRVKTRNLRADARVALIAANDGGDRFIVLEGRARLSPVSTTPGDDTGRRLAELYRALAGEHPDWQDYYRAMVDDHRLIATIDIERTYSGGAAS